MGPKEMHKNQLEREEAHRRMGRSRSQASLRPNPCLLCFHSPQVDFLPRWDAGNGDSWILCPTAFTS